MLSKQTWAEDYVECFKGQPEGWPLYPAIKSTALKPGMCGYFDVDGIWQVIVDLSDPEDVQAKGYPPVHGVDYSGGNLAENAHWGVRKSEHVEEEEITATADANIPGVPAGATIGFEYSAGSDKAAVLITKRPVVYSQATPNGPLCDWVVENGREIFRHVRKPKRGVWIVTKTYSSKKRRLAVLSSKGTAVKVGIDVTAFRNGAGVHATTAFWNTDYGALWNTNHDEDGIVLAMCGIQWKTQWFTSKVKPLEERRVQKLDGQMEIILRPFSFKIEPLKGEEAEDEIDVVRVEPEIHGEVEGIEVLDFEETDGEETEGEQ